MSFSIPISTKVTGSINYFNDSFHNTKLNIFFEESVSRFVNRRFLKSINQLRLLNLLCVDIPIIISNKICDNEKYTDINNNTLHSKILIHNQFQFNNNEEQILGDHKFSIECGKNKIVRINDSTKINIQVNELNDSRNEKEGINQELIKIEITNLRDQILPDYNKEVHTSVNFVPDESESNQVDQDNEISHKIKYLKDSVKWFQSEVQELKLGREKLEYNYRKMKELEDLCWLELKFGEITVGEMDESDPIAKTNSIVIQPYYQFYKAILPIPNEGHISLRHDSYPTFEFQSLQTETNSATMSPRD
ncbi:14884_t:CDS:2 [Gigaspora margarita]|uniref:14884_t:CDS:1 n=1 Tax=Gigaspora margarita TaxID=4874 RepID=A0ABN7V5N0_GIGMA|nr:14884_t:CDS:2 [Gigaspora margarita]